MSKETTKSLVTDGYIPLKEVAVRAKMHPVTAKKVLDRDGQEPKKLGRRCFYLLHQLDGVLTHRAYLEAQGAPVGGAVLTTASEPVAFDANGSEVQ